VARAPDHHYGHARTELPRIGLGVLGVRQRIVGGLQVEDRRLSRREILFPRGAIAGDALRRQHLRMPAFEPGARIVAWGKERDLQRLEALRVGERRIGAGADRCAHPRRARRLADIRGHQRDRAHQLRAIGREHARDPVAEGMPDYESRTIAVLLDDRGDIGGAVVQIDPGERAAAFSDAARLRPKDAVTGACEALGHSVEIACTAPERG
jgi:hypothetical protein